MAVIRKFFWGAIFCHFLLLIGSGCSTPQNKNKPPDLSKLEGKKVALIEIEGEPTAKQIAEVALVNQLVKTGQFILINKKEVESARLQTHIDPLDWKQASLAAGAEYALQILVLEFDATERQGYSSEQVEDSQFTQERGEEKMERLYKVKALEGKVRFLLKFTNLTTQELREAETETTRIVTAEAKTSAAHLPPRLRFLEELSNEAFDRFFKTYK